MENLKILEAPAKPITISKKAQWLSGEGCGSWFQIEAHDTNYFISRFSPEGKLECKGLFEIEKSKYFNSEEDYAFTYLSHCAMVTIIQNGQPIRFHLINKLQNP